MMKDDETKRKKSVAVGLGGRKKKKPGGNK